MQMFLHPFSLSQPVVHFRCSSSSTWRLSTLSPSFLPCLVLPSCIFISFHNFSIPPSSNLTFRYFLTELSTVSGNLYMFFTLCCHFHYLISLLHVRKYIPSSALKAVSLVVLEHQSISLAAAIWAASSFFISFASPSHTAEYSTFGMITFIGIFLSKGKSRCELRMTSILPVSSLSVFIVLSMCIPRIVLLILSSKLPSKLYRPFVIFVAISYHPLLTFAVNLHSLVFPSASSICFRILVVFLIFPRIHPRTSILIPYLPPP